MQSEQKRTRASRRAVAWCSVALYVAGLYAITPFGPDIQTWILARLGPRGPLLLAIPFLVAAGFLLVYAIRRRRGHMLATLTSLGAVGVAYALCLRALERPIEQIHFLLYGALGAMVFWALSTLTTGWVLYPWTIMIVSLIGMGDELLQWWLPNRVADVRDVLLNALGGILGLALLGIVVRPRAGQAPLGSRQRRALAAGVTVLAVALGSFVTAVHEFGHAIRDPAIGTFRSLFSLEEFESLNRARLAADPDEAIRDPRLRRFDVEARRHIRFQERHMEDGRLAESASERAIVQRYYRAYLTVPGRLPDPELAPGTAQESPQTFESEAYRGKIFTGFGRRAVWIAVAVVFIGALCVMVGWPWALPSRSVVPLTPPAQGLPAVSSAAYHVRR